MRVTLHYQEKGLCAVLEAAVVQEDEDSTPIDADIVKHGSNLGLIQHLDLRVTVADFLKLKKII